jgi:hypothetical protein
MQHKKLSGKKYPRRSDLADWVSSVTNPAHRSPISVGDGNTGSIYNKIYASKSEKFG